MEPWHWGRQSKWDWEEETLEVGVRKQHHVLEARGRSREEIKWSTAMDTQIKSEQKSSTWTEIRRSLMILVISVTLWGKKAKLGRVVGKWEVRKRSRKWKLFFPKMLSEKFQRKDHGAMLWTECLCLLPSMRGLWCGAPPHIHQWWLWREGLWEVIRVTLGHESRASW